MALLDPISTLTMLPIRFKKLHFELPTDYLKFFFIYDCEFWIIFDKKKSSPICYWGNSGHDGWNLLWYFSPKNAPPRFLLSAVLVLPCPTIKCPLFRIFVILNTHCSRYWEYKKKVSKHRNVLRFTGYLSSCGTLFLHQVAISQFRR